MLLLIFLISIGTSLQNPVFIEDGLANPQGTILKAEDCILPTQIKEEILSYQPLVDQIVTSILNGQFKGSTYNILAEFVDKFGHRLTGAQTLEDSIDYVLQKSIELGLENVRGEEASVPHWTRGQESAKLILPREQDLPILGLGGSVGTPVEGIRAPVIVVDSFEELNRISDQVAGKIVVYNEEYISYGQAGAYRWSASNASAYGAVATLIRSLTPYSLRTPHTGWSQYQEGLPQIPTAALTVEDAHLLRRMYDRGETIEIELKMEAQNLGQTVSRNGLAEIVGHEKPDKLVVVSGHIDSWDVGQGSMDDAAGVVLSWNSLLILNELGLIPRRTLQMIFFTAEEVGLAGAEALFQASQNYSEKFNFIMESDMGTFRPLGLHVAGTDEGACIVQEILNLLSATVNATEIFRSPIVGSDISLWISTGIPGADLRNDNEKYFWYHHSPADMLETEDSDILDLNTALWTVVSYIIADLSVDMPRF